MQLLSSCSSSGAPVQVSPVLLPPALSETQPKTRKGHLPTHNSALPWMKLLILPFLTCFSGRSYPLNTVIFQTVIHKVHRVRNLALTSRSLCTVQCRSYSLTLSFPKVAAVTSRGVGNWSESKSITTVKGKGKCCCLGNRQGNKNQSISLKRQHPQPPPCPLFSPFTLSNSFAVKCDL